jgi:hypothetical protein
MITRVIRNWGADKDIKPATDGYVQNGYGKKILNPRLSPFMGRSL